MARLLYIGSSAGRRSDEAGRAGFSEEVHRLCGLSHSGFPRFCGLLRFQQAQAYRSHPAKCATLRAHSTARAGMRARNLRVSCRAVALFAISAAAAQPAQQDLHVGVTLERRMAGGEAHSYRIEPSPGARLLVNVDQRGIDVVVEVRQPDGSILIAVDGPTDSEGPETALIPAEASGALEIRVLSPSPGVAPGTYAIRLEELATATPAERERIAAERLMTEAAASNRAGGAEGLRLAAARYEEALAHWRALERRNEEARCRLAMGGISTAL